uniref:AAA+ ATPase domain-containing protein n=1 Tax=viral metagenome TaxID=1070528 RepID=A0A6C0E384_9ZZZZ
MYLLLKTGWLLSIWFANTALSYQLNRRSLKMMDDLSTIQKYGNFFVKEPVSNLFQDITDHKLSSIFINKAYNKIYSVVSDVTINVNANEDMDMYVKYHTTIIDPIMAQPIIEAAIQNNVDTKVIDLTPSTFVAVQDILKAVGDFANFAFPLFLLVIILQAIFAGARTNQMGMPRSSMNIRTPGSSGSGGLNFLNNNNNKQKFDKEVTFPNISLSSWAGSPEVLEECKEVIAYLENKETFQQLGAVMPKGILLEGPPGTGKTLLAKGIASETNASFISMAGSEFVELFVGMGASRVRDLFDNARENKPCVIFIDEIDAVGRQRGAGINMANDEREQTLNQILYEMDGFNNNDDILVLAATNRKDVLDQALLRPGRFDRIIRVPLPDKFSREKILDFYLKSKPAERNIDVSGLAEITDGFSGAQLKNLINEAAIMSAKKKSSVILEQDLFNSFEKLIVGLVKSNNDVSINTQTRVAIHESGHALLSMLFKEYFQLQKISIQATYNGAGGYTIFTENAEIKEGGLYTKDILKKRLTVTLGGKAAENIYYGEDFVSLGAVQDLQQANKLAQRMIGNFGMGKDLEVFFNENINDESNPFLGRGISVGSKYSENTMTMMDAETLSLVVDAYNNAKVMLTKYKDVLIDMSELLKEKKVLNQEDVEQFKARIYAE